MSEVLDGGSSEGAAFVAGSGETTVIYLPEIAVTMVKDAMDINQMPNMVALIEAFGAAIQALEDQTFGMIEDTQLQNATGAQLDRWGALVGRQREGMSDMTYRRFIEAQIRINRSTGTRDEIIEIARLVFAPTLGIEQIDLYPATFRLDVQRASFTDAEMIRNAIAGLRAAKIAGVRMDVVGLLPGAFRFDVGPGFDTGLFADVLA